MASACLLALAICAHRLRVVIPVEDSREPQRMAVELTDVLGHSAPERLWTPVAPDEPAFFGGWLDRLPGAVGGHTLTESTLYAWGVPVAGPRAHHHGTRTGTRLFRVSDAALQRLVGAGHNQLWLSLHEGAQSRLKLSAHPVFGATVSPPRLRWFGSGLGHVELDLALTEAVDTAGLLEFLAGLECALREPSKFKRLRLGKSSEEGATLESLLKQLLVDDRRPLTFVAARAYTILAAQLADSAPNTEAVAEWTERLARRHNLDHRYGDREALRSAMDRRRFEGIFEVVAAEGTALLQWNSGGGAASRWYQNYFRDTWPVSVVIPITLALHERQFLQRLSDQTEGPAAGGGSHFQAEQVRLLQEQLVRYRLDKRIIESSSIDHVQQRFESARRAFRLERALSILEGDLAAGHAQLAEARQHRWKWLSGLMTGIAVLLLVLHVGEATLLAWTEHEMERLHAQQVLSQHTERLQQYEALYHELKWKVWGLLVVGALLAVGAARAVLKGVKANAGH